ncbi:flagellar biosynthetic protein FliO [Ramlibacter sp. H39-3-26]|uniref:FliO/MopB family protein n=1 Tax=Curvibacter soli TaxID=3031331 RepID=UPI0023DC7D4F|nr:flagellar biosynthetic protein FliO [Ramlibacter sp. H39-3-26]MDF1485764.1 flagellar biosynthetic protein FliO [Ramlibacter sp. H39-3-26]
MAQTLLTVVLFVVVIAMLPMALRWLQRRQGQGIAPAGSASRVISAVAVGPHQRVVTVEVGPEQARYWLVLGVTAQSIQCLHTVPLHGGGVSGGFGAQLQAASATAPAVERVPHA